MQKYILGSVIAILALPAWADVSCDFYRYTCLPELGIVEVKLYSMSDQTTCYHAQKSQAFRLKLSSKGFYYTDGPIYEEQVGGRTYLLHTDKPFVEFGTKTCYLKGQIVATQITTHALNENANGKCGAASWAVNVQMHQGTKTVYKGSFEDDCHTPQKIESVRYTVKSETSAGNITTWGVDESGQQYTQEQSIE